MSPCERQDSPANGRNRGISMDMSRMTGVSETLRPIRLAFNDFKSWFARCRQREKVAPALRSSAADQRETDFNPA